MNLKNLFAAAALATSTTLSFGGMSPTTLSLLDPANPNTFGAVLVQTSPAELFVDTFEFASIASPSEVVFSLFGVVGAVEFLVAEVSSGDPQFFSFFPEDGPLSPVTFRTRIAAATPFSLTVFGAGPIPEGGGFATGSLTYGVAVIATAVPEPETYALLMAGLVGVGAAARRKQRAASLV